MKNDLTSLHELQQAFAQGLLRFEDASIVAALKGTQTRGADRFSIYRGNLLAIWSKALSNAYPVIYQLVGAEFFEDLARSYGRRFPSQSGNLNAFGAQFADFLSTLPNLKDYPYMASVAQLEWQIHQAYFAPSTELWSLPAFLHQQGEQAQQACMYLAPSVSLFASESAAVPIWLAHQEQEFVGLPDDLTQASYAVISRPAWRVETFSIDLAAFQALSAIQRGANLEQALDLALQFDPQFDVAQKLQQWFAVGLFSVESCKDVGSETTKHIIS